MHIHKNLALHYLYNMAVGRIQGQSIQSLGPENPKAKAKKFGLNAKAKN